MRQKEEILQNGTDVAAAKTKQERGLKDEEKTEVRNKKKIRRAMAKRSRKINRGKR